ncbi:MAG: quinol monooxygenase YgiN [Reinekea sp.]|jgi:quinol monooxygenase YgiN
MGMAELVYVSITGLQLKKVWHAPLFWRHATASMTQAKAAEGCLTADARTIGGVHHTLSVWTSREAMLAYLTKGAHLSAMKSFNKIATGKVYGFETETVPDWTQVHALWHDKGHTV